MFKSLGIAIATCLFLLSTQVADAQTISLTLAANESKSITNHYMWTLNSTCSIQTDGAGKKIRVNVVKNQGKVNGKNLTTGQSTSVTVHNKDNLVVSADPGTMITLRNSGIESVEATCST